MESKKIPSIYLEAKLLVRAFEERRKVLEHGSGHLPDVARTEVLKLAGALIEEIHLLRDKTELGTFDK